MNIEIPGSATVTVKGFDGKSVQVSQAMVAQAQLGLVQPSADGTITLPGPDGKPVKIPQAALATAASTVIPNMATGKYLHSTFQIENILQEWSCQINKIKKLLPYPDTK